MSLFSSKLQNDELSTPSNYTTFINLNMITIYIKNNKAILKIILSNYKKVINIPNFDVPMTIKQDPLLDDGILSTFIDYTDKINMNYPLLSIKDVLKYILPKLNDSLDNKNFGILYTYDDQFIKYSGTIEEILNGFII